MPFKKKVEFVPNVPTVVTLLWDEPFEREGKFGTFYSYTVLHNEEESQFAATAGLHKFLEPFSKGCELVITKQVDSENKTTWSVLQSGANGEIAEEKSTGNGVTDREAGQTLGLCAKLAVNFMDKWDGKKFARLIDSIYHVLIDHMARAIGHLSCASNVFELDAIWRKNEARWAKHLELEEMCELESAREFLREKLEKKE